mmetsp:Transcript_69932/g.186313  ORF Transcript_69932/g.186313 Transcript_69932/m.186313 type:complete len:232 (-) Transcript_69932:1039-1734(-)
MGSTYRAVKICRNASAWSGGRGFTIASATAALASAPAALMSLQASSDVHSARDFCRSICRSSARWAALSATLLASFFRAGSMSVSRTWPLPWEMLANKDLILPSKPNILQRPTNSPQHNTPSSFLSAIPHVSTTSSARSRNNLLSTSASRATTSRSFCSMLTFSTSATTRSAGRGPTPGHTSSIFSGRSAAPRSRYTAWSGPANPMSRQAFTNSPKHHVPELVESYRSQPS